MNRNITASVNQEATKLEGEAFDIVQKWWKIREENDYHANEMQRDYIKDPSLGYYSVDIEVYLNMARAEREELLKAQRLMRQADKLRKREVKLLKRDNKLLERTSKKIKGIKI